MKGTRLIYPVGMFILFAAMYEELPPEQIL
jgi:hypothetical protein